MKKLFVSLLVCSMITAFAGCGNKSENENNDVSSESSVSQIETDESSESETSADNSSSATDSLELLNNIWAEYADTEKFASMGGDYAEENMTTDAPGKFGLEDTETLDSVLGLPADSVSLIDNASSLVHLMNANTFTCGAFHASSSDNVTPLADSLKDSILSRQWLCGIPEKLIIFTVDDYVISVFGAGDLLETFKSKVTSVYESAEILYEEQIA